LPGAGFRVLQVLSSIWTLPSARTPAGNKEYEYKYEVEKERAARPQQAGYRRGTAMLGDAAGVAALRHVLERKVPERRCQPFHLKSLRNCDGIEIRRIWTAIHPDVRFSCVTRLGTEQVAQVQP
jgi:hypothetical protein